MSISQRNQTAYSSSEGIQIKLEALLDGPAGTPPAGVQPNFDNPANLNTVIIITKTIALTLTTLAILIRIYTRRFVLHSLGSDDYTLILGWLGLAGYITLSLITTSAGAGVHIWDMRLGAFFRLLHWVNIVIIFYDPVNVLIKLSILLQYSRIFNPSGRKNLPMFTAINFSLLTIVLFYLILMFFSIFQCNPREMIWNKLTTTGSCYNGNAILEATGVFNVVSDFAILILPMPSIWKLQMALRQKLWVSGVFAVGSLACVVSIIRTYYTWRLAESADKSYRVATLGLCSDVELSVGVIVGCFPVMPRFFQHIGPKVSKAFSFRSRSQSNCGHESRGMSKISRINAPSKIKNPFARHELGSSFVELRGDPFTQVHGEYYPLNESGSSRLHPTTVFAPSQPPALKNATRRDDLEYGLQLSHVSRETK